MSTWLFVKKPNLQRWFEFQSVWFFPSRPRSDTRPTLFRGDLLEFEKIYSSTRFTANLLDFPHFDQSIVFKRCPDLLVKREI